jgi:hypothetical protein
MDCVRNETPLREHAHGTPLSPALEAHLTSCAVCREVVASEQRLLSEIDRALDAVGQVEPSPIFLARARAIALDPARRSLPSGQRAVLRWWPVWALPALAGALLIGALVARTRPPVEPSRGAPYASSTPPPVSARHAPVPAASDSSSPAPLLNEPLRPPTASRERAAATARSLVRPPSLDPPVIVPPGQADVIVRLATLMAAGSVAPPALLLDPPDPAQELRPPADLHFRPLAIEPIRREGADNEGDTL